MRDRRGSDPLLSRSGSNCKTAQPPRAAPRTDNATRREQKARPMLVIYDSFQRFLRTCIHGTHRLIVSAYSFSFSPFLSLCPILSFPLPLLLPLYLSLSFLFILLSLSPLYLSLLTLSISLPLAFCLIKFSHSQTLTHALFLSITIF